MTVRELIEELSQYCGYYEVVFPIPGGIEGVRQTQKTEGIPQVLIS